MRMKKKHLPREVVVYSCAAQGTEAAQINRGRIEQRMTPEQIADDQRLSDEMTEAG